MSAGKNFVVCGGQQLFRESPSILGLSALFAITRFMTIFRLKPTTNAICH